MGFSSFVPCLWGPWLFALARIKTDHLRRPVCVLAGHTYTIFPSCYSILWEVSISLFLTLPGCYRTLYINKKVIRMINRQNTLRKLLAIAWSFISFLWLSIFWDRVKEAQKQKEDAEKEYNASTPWGWLTTVTQMKTQFLWLLVCALFTVLGFLHDLVTVVNFHYLLFSPIKTLFFTLPQSSPDQRLYLNLTRGLTLTLGFSIVTL